MAETKTDGKAEKMENFIELWNTTKIIECKLKKIVPSITQSLNHKAIALAVKTKPKDNSSPPK